MIWFGLHWSLLAAPATLPQPFSHSDALVRVAGPATLAKWLSGWVAASISRAVLHIHSINMYTIIHTFHPLSKRCRAGQNASLVVWEGGVGWGGVRPITFNCTYTHTWCYARDIFSCTYTHTSCYATDVFSCTHTHIRLFTLETSSLPQTHILPATLETSYLALTHILLFTLETSSLAHTHIFMLRYRCFLLHIHILPASLYTSFLALTHILDATLETSFLAHTHRGKNVVLWRSFALQNATECYNGSSKSPGFSRCNSNMKWLRRCGAKHIWFQNMHNC